MTFLSIPWESPDSCFHTNGTPYLHRLESPDVVGREYHDIPSLCRSLLFAEPQQYRLCFYFMPPMTHKGHSGFNRRESITLTTVALMLPLTEIT